VSPVSVDFQDGMESSLDEFLNRKKEQEKMSRVETADSGFVDGGFVDGFADGDHYVPG
jgi:hypothetical protein